MADIARLASNAAALLQAGRFPEAVTAYRELLEHSPARPDAWYNLGYALRVLRRFEEALAAYAQAIERGVSRAEEVHVNRAAILSEQLFRTDEAERELRAALDIAPGFLIAWHNLGQLREDRDDRAGARQAYEAVLALAPNDGRAHARLAALDVFEGRAIEAIARLEQPLKAARIADDEAELAFAMASARDAVGDYDEAFQGFCRANALASARAGSRYDPAAQDRLIDEIIAAFPAPRDVERPEPSGPKPLFICGMFRSGSTLCEQLLARHSAITAGGELEAIPAMAGGILSPYPATIRSMSDAQLAALGNAYLAELEALFPGADIVTDKRPDNFLHIGLIKAMFPDAQVVHTVRNAVDNVLSVFFLYFADSVTYGARLEDITHYYGSYRRLMTHWRKLYPDIIDVDYDALVRAPEAELKVLLEQLGLAWEDQCDPRRTIAADVRTASAWQVRQPIHQRSTGRWRNYAAHIAELRETLSRL